MRNLSILLVAMVAATAGASAQRQFTGELRPKLAPPKGASVWGWHRATAKDLAKFTQPRPPSAKVWVGVLWITGGQPDLGFPAALVKEPGHEPCLYVDRDHKGTFPEKSRKCFHAMPASSHFSAQTEIELPLTTGPYRRFPMKVSLLKSTPKGSVSNKTTTVLFSEFAMVVGKVKLPGRSLLVGYEYNPDKGTADPTKCMQFADINNDGKFEQLERDDGENGVAPIFHVGSLYLRTTSVDLARKRVTLTSVPKGEYKRFDLWPGAIVPDFKFKTLDGKSMMLSDVKGRLVLLDFWATWCGPCVANLHSLRAIYAKYHPRGFEILGMDGDAGVEKPKLLVKKLGLTWPEGKPSSELLDKRFHITTWPTMVLLDQHGRVLDRYVGDLNGDSLGKALDRLLPAK